MTPTFRDVITSRERELSLERKIVVNNLKSFKKASNFTGVRQSTEELQVIDARLNDQAAAIRMFTNLENGGLVTFERSRV